MKIKVIGGSIFFLVLVSWGLIQLTIWATPSKQNKEAPPSPSFKTGGIIVDPEKAVAQMQKRLGPEWEKIEMVQDKWYGPYPLRNNSGWKIAQGEIWVKKGENKPYRDRPGVHRYGKGKEVCFSPCGEKATIFFKF